MNGNARTLSDELLQFSGLVPQVSPPMRRIMRLWRSRAHRVRTMSMGAGGRRRPHSPSIYLLALPAEGGRETVANALATVAGRVTSIAATQLRWAPATLRGIDGVLPAPLKSLDPSGARHRAHRSGTAGNFPL